MNCEYEYNQLKQDYTTLQEEYNELKQYNENITSPLNITFFAILIILAVIGFAYIVNYICSIKKED